MYRHDRNYEQLFNDVRNKLEQVGFCTAGSRASMKSLIFQGFSVPCLVHLKACLLISQHALGMCNLALCCQSGFIRIYKEKGDSSAFQFPKSGALLSSTT